MTSLMKRNDDFFEGLFSPTFAMDLLSGIDSKYDPYGIKSDYPYNLYVKKDKDGQVVSWHIEYALSGFTKDEIKVKVVDNELRINVEKKDNETENQTYLHNGIAHRNTRVTFKLGNLIDIDNISMKLENGLLEIKLPTITKETKEIKFIED